MWAAWNGTVFASWNGFTGWNRSKKLPVIIITGGEDAKNKERAVSGGAVAFFHKPIDHDDLLKVIRATLGEQGGVNQACKSAPFAYFPVRLLEASVAQPGRASRCQRECRGFESLRSLQFYFPRIQIRRPWFRFLLASEFQILNSSARAEVDQIHHRHSAAAGLRRRGAWRCGKVLHAAAGRGHGLDSAARGRGVLDRHFFAAAQADVDLRLRPRTDARACGPGCSAAR